MAVEIYGKTKLLAVFGYPIAHSLSPIMHNAALTALGWDIVYIPCEVRPEALSDAVRGLRAMNFIGANITIPHKQSLLKDLDRVYGDSSLSGSVNTIINRSGCLEGTSTDGDGLVQSLREEAQFELTGKRVLLFGAGGAALAIVYRLILEKASRLLVVNRSPERAVALQQKVLANMGVSIPILGLNQLGQINWAEWDLMINTTSVGLYDEQSPVPAECLQPRLMVYDLVYRKGETRLIHDARRAGCSCLTGLSMLLFQGIQSFRFWFEREPPVDVMRKALNIFNPATDH